MEKLKEKIFRDIMNEELENIETEKIRKLVDRQFFEHKRRRFMRKWRRGRKWSRVRKWRLNRKEESECELESENSEEET